MQQIFVVTLEQQSTLQHGLDQLFDEQRHPVGALDDLVADLAWQSFAGKMIRYRRHFTIAQTVQHDGGRVRVVRPHGRDLRPVSDQRQNRQVSDSVDDRIKQFTRSRVHPMDVFENRKNWSFACQASKLHDQRLQRPLLAALRAEIG